MFKILIVAIALANGMEPPKFLGFALSKVDFASQAECTAAVASESWAKASDDLAAAIGKKGGTEIWLASHCIPAPAQPVREQQSED